MKSQFLKLCSMVLIFALLLNLFPAQAIALELDGTELESTSEGTTSEKISTEDYDAKSATIVAEIPEKRTAFTKDYKLSNGFNMSVVYPEVVHYEEDGQWKEIDNTLKASGSGANGVYTNTAGGWNAIFPQQLTKNNRVSVVKDGYSVSFGMAGELRSDAELMSGNGQASRAASAGKELSVTQMQTASAKIAQRASAEELAEMEHPEIVREKLYSRLTYEDVYSNIDIVYDLNGYQLKESIVINSYDSSLRGYQYVLETGSLTPVLNDDGSIDLFAPNVKDAIMEMPAPYMVDSAGAVSYDVGISLVPQNSSYLLTYSVPTSWMADSSRVWPVVLDPAVVACPKAVNIMDRMVASDGITVYDEPDLWCGYNTMYGIVRAYIKYVHLPVISSADVVVSASLSLYARSGTSGDTIIEAHTVNEEWNSQDIAWNDQPSFDSKIEDFANVTTYGVRYSWDVTDAARKWSSGNNHGIVLKVSDEKESAMMDYSELFFSVDHIKSRPDLLPQLVIVYRNANGLENYWDYTVTSAGRAGTGYVNNYSGNLTWVRGDIGFGGNRMPVSISHIYNSSEAQSNAFGLGYGWRTNYNQTVNAVSIVDDANNELTTNGNYVWTDGDGTKHYFVSKDNEYVDEDGLELKLTVTSTGYTITDKDGNRSNFDSNGRLISMVNNQEAESRIEISYTDSTGLRISKITDGATRFYHFTYNSEDLLEKISYTGKGTGEISSVAYTYINSRLVAITDKDSESSTFTYGTNGLLETVTDVDGYKVGFSYNTVQAVGNEKKPIRVIRIQEWDDSAEGRFLTIDYTQNQTTLTDHNTNTQIIQFNDWGNVVSVQDDQGRAQFAQYARAKYGETGGKANQLTLSSKIQNTVGNMLKDSSFENGTLWNVSSSVVTRTISTEAAYHGSKSLKLVRAADGNGAGVYSSYFTLEGGETCTFSAYVKTGEGSVYLVLSDDTTPIISQTLAANSDWTRMEVSFTNTTTTAKQLRAWMMTTKAGVTYMDCAQVEVACAASRYNLVENGDFRYSGSPAYGWTASGLASTDVLATVNTAAAPELNATALKITGNPTGVKKLSQTLNISGAAGDCYVLGGWANGDSVPLGEANGVTREFGLRLIFNNADSTTTEQYVSFNCDLPSNGNWQYAATPAVATKAYSSITVQLVYSYNANTVYFDGIQLFKEQFGSSYTYDEETGDIVGVEDLQKQKTQYIYDEISGDLETVKQLIGDAWVTKMTYEYDAYHNVIKATTAKGVVYEFTYDTYGNNTFVSIVNGTTKITSSADYSDDGNRLESTTDALDKTTYYGYNENTNVLEWVEYPKDTEDNRTEYSYDSMYRLANMATTIEPNGIVQSVSYTYTDDLLTKLQTNSTSYNFVYGPFSQRTGVYVGTQALATYTYTNDRNRYLQRMTYGNDDYVQYTYDDQGRVICETYEDGSTVSYAYDNSGALATIADSETGLTTRYYYDLTDRMQKFTVSGTERNYSVEYGYDDRNNLSSHVMTVDGTTYTSSYGYDDDNRAVSVTSPNSSRECTYDAYGRVARRVTKHNGTDVLTETFTYVGNSAQVASITSTADGYSVTYTYTYDNNGNISTVSDGTNITQYLYDTANQLVREDNPVANKSWMWQYDNAGNITGYLTYDYSLNYNYMLTPGNDVQPTSTKWNTYSDSNWGDLLTQHGDYFYDYDEIGNLTSDGTWTYTWEHGRQLASMSNGTYTYTYTYDPNGLRTSKTIRGVYRRFYYAGDKLIRETWGSHIANYFYDGNGELYAMEYDGEMYYYVKNLQGDVVKMLDSDGNVAASYSYDAYGRGTASSGPMAGVNAFRYRGYYYDGEAGLYYLQSRYYDPYTGRFINADAFTSTGQGILGNNMFAYCGNNPVVGYDPTGLINWGGVAIGFGLAILTVVAVATTIATAGAASPLLATTITTIGTATSVALGEAAFVTTVGAYTEAPVVYDVTVVGGHDRAGASLVYDFGENTSDFYLHTGVQNQSDISVTVGSGFVLNYEEPGDYAGEFIDVNLSGEYKGASLGIDYCTSPDNFFNGYKNSHALLLTSGFSLSPYSSNKPTFSYDYYWMIS